MSNIKEQMPRWAQEQFFQRIEPELLENGVYELQWFISKQSLIAVLNYIRGKGYKCEWIERDKSDYLIKISINGILPKL